MLILFCFFIYLATCFVKLPNDPQLYKDLAELSRCYSKGLDSSSNLPFVSETPANEADRGGLPS